MGVSTPCSLSRGPGSRDALSGAYLNPFSKHSGETTPLPPHPNLWTSCVLRVLFFPCSLFSSCQATCVTRVSGKKAFKTYWHANPESIFGEPSFFFQNKKATGKNRQYWGEGVCFSFGQACLLSCPANVTTTALWGKSVAQTREEKCFSCKTAAKTMDLHLSPCHLATNLTCFPLLGHLLVFQALLCFDLVSPPFNFCLKFARIKLQHLYPCFTVNPFSAGIVCKAFCRSLFCSAAHGSILFCLDDLLQWSFTTFCGRDRW